MIRNLVIIAPLSAMRKRTRLAKMARYLEGRGIDVQFFGWERVERELEHLEWRGSSISERAILRGGGYASRLARVMYPLWMLAVLMRCLMLPRGTLVWALGWETAFPARIAAGVRGLHVVFDDADRFSMLIRLPKFLQAALVRLERWTSFRCTMHIVPGWSRYDWSHMRMRLLRNSPLRIDYEHALSVSRAYPKNAVTLYVNGWIAWDTGSKIVLEALRILDARDVKFNLIVAGRVASRDGEKLVALSETDFKGEIPQRDALELYRKCDLALTLYDPSVSINQHAESNKWGDCVFLGTPFIVNTEVQTAAKFVSSGAALSFPYNDPAALADIVEEVATDPSILDRIRENLKKFQSDYQPFEDQLDSVFLDILKFSTADTEAI